MVGCVKIKSNFQQRWIRLIFFWLIYSTMMVTFNTEKLDTSVLSLKKRNMIVNILINKLFSYIRHIILNGSAVVGIPILDPFEMENFHLVVPAGILNLDVQVKNITVIGFGGFLLLKNILHLSNLTFEVEVSLPRIVIAAETMQISEIDNDFISTTPIMYHKNKTECEIDNFQLKAHFHLKQSDDEKSILVDKIENAYWNIPSFKINSDEVTENFEMLNNLKGLEDYKESCKDAFTKILTNVILTFGNPILNQLDTWRYIAILL